MADAIDIELLVYVQLRTLLEANPEWAAEVDVGNRIWYNVEQPSDPDKHITADGEHPSSRLRARSGSSGLYTTDESFATYSPEGPGPTFERGTLIYRLTLTSQLLGQTEQSRLRKVTENVLRKAGPKLGLSYVNRITLRWETEEIEDDPQLGTKRERTEMDIALEYEALVKVITGEQT